MQLVLEGFVARALLNEVFVPMVVRDAHEDNVFGALNLDLQAL